MYWTLEVDNKQTKEVLRFENKYSVEEGIGVMLNF